MKTKLLLTLWVAIFASFASVAQNDCPGIPSRFKFDTLGYISANIPTDPSNPAGKLYLGQGWVQRSPTERRPGFIPTNKPSWAIAIAVAWNFARNMNQRVEYPQIGYWMATLVQETELRCATGLTWGDPSHVPNAYNPATVYAAQINNGCIQIEGPGSAWSALQQAYPNGRIPIDANSANNTALYKQLIEGVDGFEASALVKMYYDTYTSQIFNYNVGWDWYQNVDCKRQHDPYSYIKMSASNYNAGPNAYLNAKTILDNTGPGCWTGLPATTAGYANDIAKWVSVFENDPGYCEYPAGSTFDSYYNGAVPYSEVTKYLNLIAPMFPDVNFATEVEPYTQAAFTAKAGSLAGTIPFQDFGDVIDAIVLHLPVDKPTPVDGSPMGINLGCTGDFLPYGHVDILDGATNMCLGQSVTLELMVDAGNDPNLTFKWFKGDPVSGTQIGTNKTVTITPTAVGTEVYSGQICNANGCYTVYSNTQNACQDSRNLNGFNVTTRDCNLCPFVASGTAVNAVCKGTPDGSITLTMVNAPANYKIKYTATTPVGIDSAEFDTTGNSITISGVRDGAYNFVLTDLSDPTCIAYTTVIVGYDTDINEYIDAQLGNIANCKADVEAEILEHPAPCLWKVEVFNSTTFQWEPAVNAVVSTSTGKTLVQKHTTVLPAPNPYDNWTAAQPSEFYLSLNTGDRIDMGLALTTTPGATQWMPYTFRVRDEADNVVYTANAPAQSAQFGVSPTVGSYTVTCPQTVPNYTINWIPGIDNENTTATTSQGDVNVQTTDRVYVVTATNNTNPQCILKDSVIVPGDLNCGTVCKDPGTVQITNEAGTDISITDTLWVCDSVNIKTKLTGGDATGEFKYELYKDQAGQVPMNATGDFTLTDAGKYYVLAFDSTDASNTDCHKYSDTIVVMTPTKPTATLNLVDSICTGDSVQVDITLTGQQPWSIQLNDGATVTTVTGITTSPYQFYAKTARTYTVDSVFDVYCADTGSGSAVITVKTPPTGDLSGDATVCNGDSTQLTVVLAGTAPWSIKVNDGTKDSLITGIAASPYTYYVKPSANTTYTLDSVFDASCAAQGTGTAAITVNDNPSVTLGNDTSACAGPFNLDAGNSVVGQTWNWSTTETTQTISVNTAGTYWVEVAVGNCRDTDSIVIAINDTLPINIGNDTTVCSSDAPVILNGPANMATYQWASVTGLTLLGTNQQDSASTTGLYAIHVVDAAGCQGWDTINVTVNPSPNQEIWTKDTLEACAVSLPLVLDASAAAANAYVWYDDGGVTANTTNTHNANAAGNYSVKFTVNGCSDSDSVYVKVGTALSVDLGGDVTICPGDSVTFDTKIASGTYSWYESDVLVAAATGKTYNPGSGFTGEIKAIVQDANGCTGEDSVMVSVNNPLTIDLGNDIDICANETNNVTVQLVPARPGLNHAWSTGDNTSSISVLPTDTTKYYLDVDSSGCTARDSITINVNPIPVLSHLRDTFLCAGASATITLDALNAGASFVWSGDTTGNAQTQVITKAGSYTVTVTDANTCSNDTTINVDNRVATTFTLSDTTICPAGNATFTVPNNVQNEAGATWVWHDATNGTTFTANTAQAVTLTVTNASGCVSDTTVQLTVDNSQGTPITLKDTIVCPAGMATFTVPANIQGDVGATWAWHDATTAATYQSNTPGNVTLTVINSKGCTTDTTVSLGVQNYLANISISDISACARDRVEVKSGFSGSAYSYSWNGGAANNTDSILIFDPVAMTDAGNITLDISTADGCSGNASMTLTVNTQPVNALQAVALCAGQSATLDAGAGAGYSYEWSHDATLTSQTATVSNAGFYGVTITDANGCKNDTTVNINPSPLPVLNLTANPVYCEGTTVDLQTGLSAADHTFQWSGGSSATTADIQVTTSGTYTVVATNNTTTCSNTDNVTITFAPVPNIVLPSDTSFCLGESITLTSSDINPAYTYSWISNGVEVGTSESLTISEGGSYLLSVVNGSCTGNSAIVATIDSLPKSYLMNDTTLCFEDVDRGLLLDPGNEGISYLWSTGETIEFIRVDKPGTYSVKITNATGCVTNDEVTIIEDCPSAVWLPTSFSPNQDGLNDSWELKGRGVEGITVEIYNRWGELIWTGNSIGNFWDGTHFKTGQDVPIDVYVYRLSYTYKTSAGSLGTRKRLGTVTIIR